MTAAFELDTVLDMAATLLIPGTLREVWQELVPLDGGDSRPIPTGLRVTDSLLPRLSAVLYAQVAAGAPQLTATVANVNGFAVVTVTNGAPAGNSATYNLDITKLQSTQQGIGGATGIVHIVVGGSASAGFVPLFVSLGGSVIQCLGTVVTADVGPDCVLLGPGASAPAATASSSIVGGAGAISRNSNNLVLGPGAVGDAPSSIVFGPSASVGAGSNNGIACGLGAAVANASVDGMAFGTGSKIGLAAQANFSFAFGYQVTISSSEGLGFGRDAVIPVGCNQSMVFGTAATASAPNEVLFGSNAGPVAIFHAQGNTGGLQLFRFANADAAIALDTSLSLFYRNTGGNPVFNKVTVEAVTGYLKVAP